MSGSHLAAVFGAWSFCWSPELFYHSINALPDIMALTCALGALFCFLKWDQLKQKRYYWLSLLLITLGGFIKIQYLMFGGVVGIIVARNIFAKKYSSTEIKILFAYAMFAIGLTIGWYIYAHQLIETNNLHDFGIEIRPAHNWDQALKILKDNFVSDLPELFLNYQEDLLKDLQHQKGFLLSVEKKLTNEKFVANAKPEVLAMEQKKKADALARIKTIEESLSTIS